MNRAGGVLGCGQRWPREGEWGERHGGGMCTLALGMCDAKCVMRGLCSVAGMRCGQALCVCTYMNHSSSHRNGHAVWRLLALRAMRRAAALTPHTKPKGPKKKKGRQRIVSGERRARFDVF